MGDTDSPYLEMRQVNSQQQKKRKVHMEFQTNFNIKMEKGAPSLTSLSFLPG